MKNEDAIAEFLLKEVETRESLRKRMNESALDYYTGRHLFGMLAGLFFTGMLVYVSVSQNVPIWGVISLAMAMIALMESKRNSGRVDAMVKLSNMSESEPVGAGQPHLRRRKSENHQ